MGKEKTAGASQGYAGPRTELADGLPAGPDAVPPEQRTGERRSHSLGSFVYGGFRPRRRQGRRDGDHNEVFLDWHEPSVLYLCLAILLLSCADALFTLNLLAVGAEELNAVMRFLIVRDVSQFLWVKIGVTGTAVIFLAVAARRHLLGIVPVIRILQGICLAYLALIGWELYLLAEHFPELPLVGRFWGAPPGSP